MTHSSTRRASCWANFGVRRPRRSFAPHRVPLPLPLPSACITWTSVVNHEVVLDNMYDPVIGNHWPVHVALVQSCAGARWPTRSTRWPAPGATRRARTTAWSRSSRPSAHSSRSRSNSRAAPTRRARSTSRSSSSSAPFHSASASLSLECSFALD